MPSPNFMILYVDNPPASAAFYADLLGQQAAETSPTFALFALPSGLMLGLWSRHTVEPPPTDMDFGHTFVALDPDGHRLRVFSPAGGEPS